MTDPRPRVLLLGTHGQHNIGDELLLETFLAGLGEDIDYIVNSYDVPFTSAQLAGRYQATVFDTAAHRFSLWRHLGAADALVFAGGSIVKELYRSTGRFRYATLLMLLAVVLAARVRRVPIAMLHIGVGPLPSRWGRRIAGWVLRRADLVTVRDASSAQLCRELDVMAHESVDVVFSATARWCAGGDIVPRQPSRGPVRIALNLNFHIADAESWEHFQDVLAHALTALARHHRIELHALPLQSEGKEHDDASVLRGFAQRLDGIPMIEHDLRDHRDVARVIADCDVVVCERFHALVLAAILGVASYALAYDVKVSGLVDTLGTAEWSSEISRDLDASMLARDLGSLVAARIEVSSASARRAAELRPRARADLAAARAWLRREAGTW